MAQDLVSRLLVLEPENRLGFGGMGEVKSHAFFDGIDWDALFTNPSPLAPR